MVSLIDAGADRQGDSCGVRIPWVQACWQLCMDEGRQLAAGWSRSLHICWSLKLLLFCEGVAGEICRMIWLHVYGRFCTSMKDDKLETGMFTLFSYSLSRGPASFWIQIINAHLGTYNMHRNLCDFFMIWIKVLKNSQIAQQSCFHFVSSQRCKIGLHSIFLLVHRTFFWKLSLGKVLSQILDLSIPLPALRLRFKSVLTYEVELEFHLILSALILHRLCLQFVSSRLCAQNSYPIVSPFDSAAHIPSHFICCNFDEPESHRILGMTFLILDRISIFFPDIVPIHV